MPTTLKKAPLVELVADLRWAPSFSSAQDETGALVTIPQSLVDPSQAEQFFQQFGGAIYQHGFKSVERLIPHGVPLLPDQMVCRYRQAGTDAQPVLVQIGTNQFSVNALPPYKSWVDFRPWIEKAVAALLEVRPDALPFRASVRYIDAFRRDLTQGKNPTEFLDSDLGIGVKLPEALAKLKRGAGKVKSSVTVNIPIDDMQMTVQAGEGLISGETVTILNTQVTSSPSIAPNIDAVMSAFDSARAIIHNSFMELVKPIIDRFEPTGN